MTVNKLCSGAYQTAKEYFYPIIGVVAGVALAVFLNSQLPADSRLLGVLFAANFVVLPSLLGGYAIHLNKDKKEIFNRIVSLGATIVMVEFIAFGHLSPALNLALSMSATAVFVYYLHLVMKEKNEESRQSYAFLGLMFAMWFGEIAFIGHLSWGFSDATSIFSGALGLGSLLFGLSYQHCKNKELNYVSNK